MTWTGRTDSILPVDHLLDGDRTIRAYRAIQDENHAPTDFTSHYERDMPARGIEARSTPIWQAVSMFTTRQALESRIRRFPAIGTAVAELQLTPDHGIAFAQTISPGHLSVWADPQTLDNSVTAVYAV